MSQYTLPCPYDLFLILKFLKRLIYRDNEFSSVVLYIGYYFSYYSLPYINALFYIVFIDIIIYTIFFYKSYSKLYLPRLYMPFVT